LENHVAVDFFSPSMGRGETPFNLYTTMCGFHRDDGWYRHFARYGRLVFFPRTPQPFAQSVLEAYLLGLEVTVSGRIGCESFGVGLDGVAEMCAESAAKFWDVMSNAV